MTLREDLQTRLDRFDVQRIRLTEGTRAAGVAVVVARQEGRHGIWLTRRPSKMRRHAAQFALPGGRVDGDETTRQAALRELSEELGISLGEDAILGDLDDYPTRSGFVMSPTVLWCDDEIVPHPDPDEVEHLYLVGLDELVDVEPILERIPESDRPVLSLPLIGRRIHAPTAAVIYQFARVALNDDPARVSGYDQPVFAWQ